MWQLYLVVGLAGVGSLFEGVAAQSLIPSLVPRAELLPANSSLMLANATVTTSGSALGGMHVAVLGAPFAIAADAASFLFSGLVKARIRNPGESSAVLGPGHRLWGAVGVSLSAVVAHPALRAMPLAAALGAVAGQMQNALLVLFLVRDAGLPAGRVGVCIGLSGAAAILGSLMAFPLTRRIGPGPSFIIGVLVAASGGLVLAGAPGLGAAGMVLLAIGQMLRGAGPSVYGPSQQTLRQSLADPRALSRVNATWRFIVFGTQPLGAMIGGLLGSAAGLPATLIVSSVLMLIAAGIATASPLRSLKQLPAAPT